MDFKKLSCKVCRSKSYCNKRSISKGSKICQQNLNLIQKEQKEKTPSVNATKWAIIGSMLQKSKGDGNDRESS